jgi:Spy/CpxP family protein refolding chaperone
MIRQPVNRRVPLAVSLGAVALVAATFWHIGELTTHARQMQDERNAAVLEVAALRSEAAKLRAATDSLQSAVSRFDSEDWREVVPAVRSATFDTEQAAERLAKKLRPQ